ncbi:MAG: enoyl-CoA hydratase-related protein [Burkholderiales bacterium]
MIDDTAMVEVEADGPVTLVRMTVPAKRNALVAPMREALIAALEAQMGNTACRAIVLTGVETSFCAGGDLDALPDHDPLAVRARMQRGQHLVRLLAAGPKPVIAAVNGAAHGAGLSLAAACDVVFAADSAKFGAVFAKVGLMADLGLLWSLRNRIGLSRTKRMLYGGAVIDADEAHRIGLADERATDAGLLDAALAYARTLADAPPVAVALTKAALARPCGSLEEALAQELDGQTLLFSTDDYVEGRNAFRERRATRFEGR